MTQHESQICSCNDEISLLLSSVDITEKLDYSTPLVWRFWLCFTLRTLIL